MGFSRYWKKARRQVKQSGRQVLKAHSQVQKVLRPVAVAAGGFFGGAAGAAAVGAGTHYLQQYATSAGARYDELRGHAARAEGRDAAQKTALHSAIAGGAGMLGSGVASALAGKNVFAGTFLGQGGSELVGAGSIFSSSPQATTVAESFPGSSTFVGPNALSATPAATSTPAWAGAETLVTTLDPVKAAVAVPTASGAGGTMAAVGALGAAALGAVTGGTNTGAPMNGGATPPFNGPGGGYEGASGSYPVGSLDSGGRPEGGGVGMGTLAAMAIAALVLMKG